MNVNSFQSAIALRTFENLVKTYCEVVSTKVVSNLAKSEILEHENIAQ